MGPGNFAINIQGGAQYGYLLLFQIPLLWGGLLTAVVTFVILGLERFGFRPLEAVITMLVGIIAVFLYHRNHP